LLPQHTIDHDRMSDHNDHDQYVRAVMAAAIECNNAGVELLTAGQLESALGHFRAAARIMHPVSRYYDRSLSSTSCRRKQQQQDVATSGGCEPTEPSWARCDDFSSSAAAMIVQGAKSDLLSAAPRPHQNKKDDSRQRHENYTFLMSVPFKIDSLKSLPDEKQHRPLTSCTFESAVIVFNMGLVYRLSGTTTSLLRRAWSLFDMAFGLVFSTPAEDRVSKIGMACLNNAGEVQAALGNYRLCRQYLDALRTVVVSLPPPADAAATKERHELLLNVMLLGEPMAAGAA